MTIHIFPPFVAVDPSNPNVVAAGETGQVYATTDLTFTTPLTITSLNDQPLTELEANQIGLVQGFRADCDGTCVWKSGLYVVPMMAPKSILDAALAAAAAAAASASNGVPTGGTTGQVLRKNSSGAYDASWFTLIHVIGPTDAWPTGLPSGTVVVRTET